MKTLFTSIACLIVTCQAFAQYAEGDMHAAPAKKRNQTQSERTRMMDGVEMKNSRMYVVKNGQEMSMYDDVVMLDGTKVHVDGTITKLDGTKVKMQDGQRMFLSGVMDKMPVVNFVTLQGGKMVLVKDTVNIMMDRMLSTDNGTKIFPEGYVVTTDGKKVPFAEGDRMNLEGVWMEPVRSSYSSQPTQPLESMK